MRHARIVAALAAAFCCSLVPAAAAAQAAPWESVHQPAAWYGAFAEQALSHRVAFWFDGQWRRSGLIDEPQQVLVRPGVLLTLAPGVRVGGGYAWIATAPYGEAPAAAPLREHRAWQQLVLSHQAGPLSVSHRYRWEQRWLASVGGSGLGDWQYQQRARYMIRAQGGLPGFRFGGAPVMGFAWGEALLPVGHGDAALRFTQNRLGAGVGLPVSARQRVEVGYMNLWNSLSARQVNEFNHTLTVSWVLSPAPRG